MAQHDYVIDNSTGQNVRQDINNVLQAIASNNSGSSAPSTTYALQSFANTTDSMLQLRNAANNAFVNLRKFDGTLPLPDGSVSSPSLFFDDDINTGIFSSAADTFNVATGGVERMELGATTIFNEDGADVDFRIEGDTDANLFFVDAGNNRVGIGTNNPTHLLHIESAPSPAIKILDTTNNTNLLIYSQDADSHIGTYSNHPLVFDANSLERLRIDESGRLLYGLTSSTRETSFILQGNSNSYVTNPGVLELRVGQVPSSQAVLGSLLFGCIGDKIGGNIDAIADNSDWSSGSSHPTALRFFTTPAGSTTQARRMTIDSSGNVLLGPSSVGSTSEGLVVRPGNESALYRDSGIAFVVGGGESNQKLVEFRQGGTGIGSISKSGTTGISYLTSSDYRLKENAVAISDGISRLKTLKPYRFNFKSDASTTIDGFFAHEVTAVPEAITGVKDEVETTYYDEGDTLPEGKVIGDVKNTDSPVYQGIDQSKLVPLLVAAVQELIAKVEALEAA